MKQFIQQFGNEITSILSGWDRLTMRGSLRRISYSIGMTDFLFKTATPLKAFGQYAQNVTRFRVLVSRFFCGYRSLPSRMRNRTRE